MSLLSKTSSEKKAPDTASDLGSSELSSSGQYDAVQEALFFLAHYFNRSVDKDHITAGIPLPEQRITVSELPECAGRAGLSVTPVSYSPEKIKSSMLPILIVGGQGDAVTLLNRQKDKVECAIPGIEGSRWMPYQQLQQEYPGDWFFVRPVMHFDARSLLYSLPEYRRWFWDVFKENRHIYGWALLGTAAINIFAIVLPFYTMAVYDRVVPNNALDSLWVLTTAVITILSLIHI